VAALSFLIAQWELPENGLMRVIGEQADKLVKECEDAKEDPAAFAHKARVRCKKIRAALRLAAPLMGKKEYARDNRWWRDSARELSGLRDVSARIEALEALRPFLTARIGTAMMRRLTDRFERERRAMDAGPAVAAFCRRVKKRRNRLTPELNSGGREVIAEALGDTYREARKAMKAALKKREPVLLHEWRKQTKYHALQTRLMRMGFPEMLQARTGTARELAELLGTAQDIEVVLEGAEGWEAAPEGFFDALKDRRAALIDEAEKAGKKLFADKPKVWAAATLQGEAEQVPEREEAEA
jgi:hypothetical protein